MQKLAKGLKKYPIVVLFFALLAVVSLVDTLQPAKAFSTYENRRLAQAPAFNAGAFLNNEWTLAYADYVKEQFIGRDGWISLQSVLETAQGKLENNGVWYAQDGYQIAKQEAYSETQLRTLATNRQAVLELGQRHAGRVSAMVVPSPANVLEAKLRFAPPVADEDAVLDEMFTAWEAAGIGVLDMRGMYAGREDEYLFYRTDHHWTTTGGAWLAYEAFCAARGLEAVAPAAPLVEVADFYGTNYAKTKKPGTVPDVLAYYDLPNVLTVYSFGADSVLAGQEGPLMETEKLAEYDKYAAFLRGNNGFSVVEGSGEGSILLIKDSYGNCFAPYLLENYATVGIVDLRTWLLPVDDLIEEYGFEDILVLYCFDSFSNETTIYRLQDDFQ